MVLLTVGPVDMGDGDMGWGPDCCKEEEKRQLPRPIHRVASMEAVHLKELGRFHVDRMPLPKRSDTIAQ